MVEGTQLDGIEWLVQDHGKIRHLFDQWKETPIQAEKNLIVEKLIREVCTHASTEERYLYPLIKEKILDGDLLMQRNYLDDQVNKVVLQFLLDNLDNQKNDTDRSVFNNVVEKFIVVELEHLQQEEDQVFPRLKSVLTYQELQRLYGDLINGKENAPTHPHPYAPMQYGSKFLHPIAGALDKILDMGVIGTGILPASSSKK